MTAFHLYERCLCSLKSKELIIYSFFLSHAVLVGEPDMVLDIFERVE